MVLLRCEESRLNHSGNRGATERLRVVELLEMLMLVYTEVVEPPERTPLGKRGYMKLSVVMYTCSSSTGVSASYLSMMGTMLLAASLIFPR